MTEGTAKPGDRILLVEDDESLGFVIQDNLENSGYVVDWRQDGNAGLHAFAQNTYDLLVLDVMLPGKDGFTLAREIKSLNKSAPIIFLTAKSSKEDKIQGFRAGADDYMIKPFSIEELILRMDAVLRRCRNQPMVPEPPPELKLGQFTLDYANLDLKDESGKGRRLTQREADVLKLLLANANQVLRRENILTLVWGENDYFLGRSLDVFISRLRKYLKSDPSIRITNVHGVGFRLETDISDSEVAS